jgi:iron complex transport system substrate-binding protein
VIRITLLAGFLVAPFVALAGEMTDDHGSVITVNRESPRVVALAPHLVELVFAVGAGQQLVGAVEWSDYPPAAEKVPRVGDAFRMDFERIIELQPDLVLAWGSGTPTAAIARLRELGMQVAVLQPEDLESIAVHLEWLGKLLGHSQAGTDAAARFRDEVENLRDEFADTRTLDVFYQIQMQPLYTVSGEHPISEMIVLCGGRNIFADVGQLAPAVTREAVLAENPQVIVSGYAARESGELASWQQWKNLDAVRFDNLLAVDAQALARSTPRMLEAGRELCEHMEKARRRTNNNR